MNAKNTQRLMYLLGFLDLGGVMLIIPLFVVHLRTLGMTPLVGGVVRSLYGILQLLSSPLVGRWSDKYGRRPLLLACLGVTAVGYFVLGATNSVLVMVVSRIVTGVFKHSTTLCKAVLADVTEVEERSQVLGKFNAAMGVAVILGPAVGGNLTDFENGFRLVCNISTLIFVLNLALCFAFLPNELPYHSQSEKHKAASKKASKDQQPREKEQIETQQEGALHHIIQESEPSEEEQEETLGHIIQVMRDIDWRVFGDIFLIDFFLTFAAFAYRASFVLIIDQMFGATPKTIGYIISFQGIIGAVAGFLTGRISKLYQNSQLELFHGSLLQGVALFGLTFAPNVITVILLLIPLSLSSTVIHTSTSTIIIERSDPSKIGSVTGFGQSIQAIATMTTPLLSSIAQEVSVYGPGVMASFSAVVGATFAGYMARTKKIKKEKES